MQSFDREQTGFYRLVIAATPIDGTPPQRTVVVVNVEDTNDNAPRYCKLVKDNLCKSYKTIMNCTDNVLLLPYAMKSTNIITVTIALP